MAADVLDLNPDWVSVMIGVNDVWRRVRRTGCVRRARVGTTVWGNLSRADRTDAAAGEGNDPDDALFLNQPGRSHAEGSGRAGAVTKKLAEEYGLLCVDVQGFSTTICNTVTPLIWPGIGCTPIRWEPCSSPEPFWMPWIFRELRGKEVISAQFCKNWIRM